MAKFEVKFDGISYTDNPSLTELELDDAQLALLTGQMKSRGELPAGVLSIIEAHTSPDDAQSENDCKVFMTITLLVEADDALDAENMEPPEAFLAKVVSAMIGDEDGSLELDGAYEVLEVSEHEAQ